MPTGSIAYFSDQYENVLRISEAGRLFSSSSYSRIKNHSPINVSAASGGSTFESVPVGGVRIYSESGNSIMWIGGASTSGADSPYSGHGLPLYGGEESELLPVTNFDTIRICASVSGQIVYAIGFLNGEDTILPNEPPDPAPVTPVVSGGAPDIGAPYILSHSPVSGFSGVALGSELSVVFNEEILQSSVTSGSFALSPAANVTVYRDVTYANKVMMVPNGVNLSGSTQYVASINSQITDVSGNPVSGTYGGWLFTFPFTTQAEPDVTAPQVSGTNPANGATNVSAGSNVTVTFSESMASGTITAQNLYLSYTQGVVPTSGISGTVSLASDLFTATINPTPTNLNSNTAVYINVLSGVTDLYDNSMAAADTARSFTTETYDTTPPRVTATVPASGTSGVAADTDVIVTFSEQVLSGTVNVNTLYISDISGAVVSSGIPATVTLSGNNLSAEIDPSYNLSGGGTFYINALSGITDLIGNNLSGGNYQGTTFTVLGTGYTTVYDLLSGSSTFNLNGDNVMGGVYVASGGTGTLVGKTPVRFIVKKKKVGNPTGTGRINIYNSSNALMYSGSGLAFDVSTISTDFTDYTYTDNSQSRTLQLGDYVAVSYSGGNVSNYLQLYYHNTDQVSGTYFIAYDAGGYDYITGFDFSMKIQTGGGGAGDTTPPTVSGTVPVSGATEISLDSSVVVTFSEGMSSSTVNAQNLYLSYLSGAAPTSGISGTVTLSGNLLAAEINPTNNLSGNATVNINILSGVKDFAGNNMAAHDRSRTFSTIVVDTTAPTISGIVPLSGATQVATNSNVVVTFSEQMLESTINTFNLYVSDISGAIAASGIPAAVTLSGNNLAAEINPTSNLAENTTFNINVLADVKDLAGNNMAAHDRSRTFATVDTIAPTVVSTYPASGATGVASGVTAIVTFSEAMASGTITTSNLYLSKLSGAVAASGIAATVMLSGNLLAASIDPSSNLDASGKYWINVLSGVTDIVGNSMAAHDREKVFWVYGITPYTEIYNVARVTDSSIYAGSYTRIVEGFTAGSSVIGKTPKQVKAWLSKSGSPTGNISVTLRDSAGTLKATFGTIDSSTLTGTATQYTVTNDAQNQTVATGDFIGVEYDGGSGSNYVLVGYNDSNVYANGTLYSYHPSLGTYAPFSDYDTALEIYY